MTATTTIRLSPVLKAKVNVLARESGRTSHSFMVEAIERHAAREARMREFVREALAADRHAERTGELYSAADVHAWLARLARGGNPRRPKRWRE